MAQGSRPSLTTPLLQRESNWSAAAVASFNYSRGGRVSLGTPLLLWPEQTITAGWNCKHKQKTPQQGDNTRAGDTIDHGNAKIEQCGKN